LNKYQHAYPKWEKNQIIEEAAFWRNGAVTGSDE